MNEDYENMLKQDPNYLGEIPFPVQDYLEWTGRFEPSILPFVAQQRKENNNKNGITSTLS